MERDLCPNLEDGLFRHFTTTQCRRRNGVIEPRSGSINKLHKLVMLNRWMLIKRFQGIHPIGV
jgi:hypothetical protein